MTEGTQAITSLHMVLIAILAVLVVIGIVAGMRLKRGRVAAQREVAEHAAEAGVPPAPPVQDARTAADPTPPVSPPPAADQPLPGTPSPVDEAPPERPMQDEPIAAAIAPDGTTATIAADAGLPDGDRPEDGPVTQLKGLGPKVQARLAELGITRVGQLAVLDADAAAALDAELGSFAGRIARDRWIEQARFLAAGDRDGFERVFGRL